MVNSVISGETIKYCQIYKLGNSTDYNAFVGSLNNLLILFNVNSCVITHSDLQSCVQSPKF